VRTAVITMSRIKTMTNTTYYGNDISTNSCILSSNSFQYLIIKVEIILDLEIKMLDEALRTIY